MLAPAKLIWCRPEQPTCTMSAQKYSYKPADAAEASTVILLKDGSALEVRRGSKTTWTKGEGRRRWASLATWKETLPAEAQVTEGGAASAPLSPELKRVVDGLKRAYGPKRNGLRYGSSSERTQRYLRGLISDARSINAISPLHGATWRAWAAENEARLAAITPTPRVYSVDPCVTLNTPILYCKAADGGLRRVWFSSTLGLFGVRDGSQVRAAPTLAELGFPADTEMWGRRQGQQDLVKL